VRKLLYKKGRKVIPTLIEYTGKHENATPEMQLFVYNSEELSEFEDIKLSQLDKHLDTAKNNWINLHGLSDVALIKEIGIKFKIDDFILGDILNILKRSKVEEHNHTLFFNIKSFNTTVTNNMNFFCFNMHNITLCFYPMCAYTIIGMFRKFYIFIFFK